MEKKDLKPAGVFHYFEEICQVPRPSKKEEKIIAYLKAFGEKHKLETKVDEAGNVLIKKPATPGMENRKTVVLQSHIDMVCEKNNDVKHDFLTDPIETEIDGEWLKAKGTTLGADNGIGVATELAILADDSIEHGPIECLFTVDEETGLTGAFALKEGFMNGDILLNLDSEDEGELFIGCAGGIDSVAEFTYREVDVPAGYFCCKVQVKGLKGGHSGGDIHLGRGNANKLLNRFLSQTSQKYDMYLCEIDGGNLRNAIAREAHAVIAIPDADKHDDKDETYLGSQSPKWTGGFNNNFSYKNFDLNVYIIARWGQMIDYELTGSYDPQGKGNFPAYLNYWTPENPSNDFPRPAQTNFYNYLGYQTLNYIDGSYWKIKTVSLGYTFPKSLTSKLGVSKLRAYVTANNLFSFAKNHLIQDYDAERGGSAKAPLQRQFIFGLNLDF